MCACVRACVCARVCVRACILYTTAQRFGIIKKEVK